MNYIVIYKKDGKPKSEFFRYRDETCVGFKEEDLIKDEDDVIRIMRRYYSPDNDEFVIKETFLDIYELSDREIFELMVGLYRYI